MQALDLGESGEEGERKRGDQSIIGLYQYGA
jgi:hypothetical protein